MLSMIILATVLLAAANGANDNIKGAATLIGSGVIGFRAAIGVATAATALGGLASIVVANGLLAAFSGKGIVADALTASPEFLLAVALGAGATVALATRIGMPISTTHALLGGLMGAGLASADGGGAFGVALRAMALPLLLSPLVALVLALGLVPLAAALRRRAQPVAVCACSDDAVAPGDATVVVARTMTIASADAPQCQPAPQRSVHRVPMTALVDHLHLLSAAAVSFARGLNDTPKIAALMFAAGAADAAGASMLVVAAMAAGGLLAARRVAQTLAFGVTRMDAGQGLGANLVTSALVILASRYGMPVSTTHVSTGALFGIAVSNRSGGLATIRNILLAWLLTLPAATLLAYLGHLLIA